MPKNSLFISKKNLFLINLGVWAVLAGLAILKSAYYAMREGNDFAFTDEHIWMTADYLALWLLSFLIYILFQHTHKKELKPFLLIHLPLSLLFGLMNLALSMILMMSWMRMLKPHELPFWKAFGMNMTNYLGFSINGLIVYWLVMLGLFTLSFYARYKNQHIVSLELESKLNQSQLQTLKMQLQPHFLFNALNTISMMVRNKKGNKAVQMISGLSELLRESLSREGKQFVSFEEEVALVKQYLEIEQIRFKDRLTVHLEIDPASREVPFPSLLLQPILENAFKHGISQSMEAAILRVKSELIEGKLHVWIDNSGPTLPEDWKLDEQEGIGLANTQSRLWQLYGDKATLSLFNLSLTGVSAHIIIPATAVSEPDRVT